MAWYGWYRRCGHFGVFHCQFLLLSWRFAHGYAVWDLQWARRWSLQDATLPPRCLAINEDSGREGHAVADTATKVTPSSREAARLPGLLRLRSRGHDAERETSDPCGGLLRSEAAFS